MGRGGGNVTSAFIRHRPQASGSVDGVGLVQQRGGGDEETSSGKREFCVEVVIRQIHPLLRVRSLQIRRPLLRAWEVGVGGTERRFPDLAELVQDVRNLRLVGVVVHEYHHALLLEYEFRKRGPIVDAHGYLRRDVRPSR